MSERSRPHVSVGVQLGTTADPRPAADADTPFRIALFGDFSARSQTERNAGGAAPWAPKATLIDRDNYEDVLEGLKVELRLPDPAGGLTEFTLGFREIDDFHPDEIFARADVFRSLADLRERLSDPHRFADAAREIQSWSSSGDAVEATADPSEPPPPSDPAQLLNQIIGGAPDEPPPAAAPAPTSAKDALKQLLAGVVSEHVVPAADPRQDVYLAQLDDAIAAHMRAILHHPDFQALEAAWRAVHFLIRRLETGTELKLYLVDCTKAELTAALTSADELPATEIYKFLVDQAAGTQGADPWSLWIGNYAFAPTQSDLTLLAHIAPVAAAAGAPFLAAADATFVGAGKLAETPDPDDWQLAKTFLMPTPGNNSGIIPRPPTWDWPCRVFWGACPTAPNMRPSTRSTSRSFVRRRITAVCCGSIPRLPVRRFWVNRLPKTVGNSARTTRCAWPTYRSTCLTKRANRRFTPRRKCCLRIAPSSASSKPASCRSFQ